MSVFQCPHCRQDTPVFGQRKVEAFLEDENLALLGSIPLEADICHEADRGRPMVLAQPTSHVSQVYQSIAKNVLGHLESIAPKSENEDE
jgi:ATP-binding protein involved in chromosome partitioning